MPRAGFSSTSYLPDSLNAGDAELLSRKITVKSGQNLTRGAVIGKDSAGKYLLSLAAAEDDSEVPDMILAEDCNATGGDAQAIAYFTGIFNERALTLGTGHTANSIREGLRIKGIHLVPGVPS